MFYIAPDTLPSIEDFLNLLAGPSTEPEPESKDKSIDDMVEDHLYVDPSYTMTDWLTFDKAFECVAANLNPSKGVENLLMVVASLNEVGHRIESIRLERVDAVDDENFCFESSDGCYYDNNGPSTYRFQLAIPKKDIRKLNPRDTVSAVTLKDGKVLKNGTVVKGGVLFVNDAGEVDIYTFSDIEDFVS